MARSPTLQNSECLPPWSRHSPHWLSVVTGCSPCPAFPYCPCSLGTEVVLSRLWTRGREVQVAWDCCPATERRTTGSPPGITLCLARGGPWQRCAEEITITMCSGGCRTLQGASLHLSPGIPHTRLQCRCYFTSEETETRK